MPEMPTSVSRCVREVTECGVRGDEGLNTSRSYDQVSPGRASSAMFAL